MATKTKKKSTTKKSSTRSKSKAARPTLKAMKEAIWPAMDEAGKKVAAHGNDQRVIVQEAAAEVNSAILQFSQGRIEESDLRKITETWAQTVQSSGSEKQHKAGQNIVEAMKAGAAAALKLLFKW